MQSPAAAGILVWGSDMLVQVTAIMQDFTEKWIQSNGPANSNPEIESPQVSLRSDDVAEQLHPKPWWLLQQMETPIPRLLLLLDFSDTSPTWWSWRTYIDPPFSSNDGMRKIFWCRLACPKEWHYRRYDLRPLCAVSIRSNAISNVYYDGMKS